MRDLIVAPIIGEAGPLGAIEVISHEPDAFDELDAAVLGGLAEQAAIAITNARLIDELERSQRRPRPAGRDRALAARHHRPHRRPARPGRGPRARRRGRQAPARDRRCAPDADGARAAATSSRSSSPAAPTTRPATGCMGMRFPLGGGINGLAAQDGVPVWTSDYLADPRIPHEPDDQDVARRLGLVGMAAAPLRAPGGEVIGTLADLDRRAARVRGRRPRPAPGPRRPGRDRAHQLEPARAGHPRGGALPRVSSRRRPTSSGEPTPTASSRSWPTRREALFGWPIEQIIGEHFGFLTDPESMPIAREAFEAVGRDPDLVERVPLILVRQTARRSRPRSRRPASSRMAAGSAPRARSATCPSAPASSASCASRRSATATSSRTRRTSSGRSGADARLTFLSDAVERLTGFRPDELLGQHFGALVHESSRDVAEIDWTAALAVAARRRSAAGSTCSTATGRPSPPSSSRSPASTRRAAFAGANGSVRDMRERDRLERDLRASEERYRNLASSSPDIVFATDAEGRYTFLSDRAATMLGWDLERSARAPVLRARRAGLGGRGGRQLRGGRRRPDDGPLDPHRLPRRRRARRASSRSTSSARSTTASSSASTASPATSPSASASSASCSQSEERYRFLVQNSPDIVFSTDAEGRFTFLSDAVERMTGYQLGRRHRPALLDRSSTRRRCRSRGDRWAELVADPDREQQANLVLRGADGRLRAGRRPGDRRSPTTTRSPASRARPATSATRSGSRRELRRQAGELAAGEERAHLARELHDSVTQALFSMTLVVALGRDAARPRPRRGARRSWPSCASSSARPSPRCAR